MSGKRFRYVMEGDIPAGVSGELLQAAVLSSVSWTGNMLLHCKHQSVEIIDQTPDDAAGASGRILRVN